MTKGPRKVKLVIVVNNKKDPPTFKTLTPTSRTQLKQQLMREHAQEQLRRESLQAQTQPTSKPVRRQEVLPIPTSTSSTNLSNHHAVEVPPQVLQVRTVLENPTRYHVIQKQKSQVRQFLSESFQPRQEANSLLGNVNVSTQVHSAPAINPTAAACSPEYDPFASNSSLLSPHCSVTTSNSETDDFFDDLLSLEGSGTAFGAGSVLSGDLDSPGDLASVKQENLSLSEADVHAITKDRQKKDNHNMIERRRRFNINDRIKELGTLLPKTNDPFYEVIRDVRPNKGTILKSSVDYIKCLREEVNKLKQTEHRMRQLEMLYRKVLLRNQELERQATAMRNCSSSDFNQNPSPHDNRKSMDDIQPAFSAPVTNNMRNVHRNGPLCHSVDTHLPPSNDNTDVSINDTMDSLRLGQFSDGSSLGCLNLDSTGGDDVLAAIPASYLDQPSTKVMELPSSPSMMLTGDHASDDDTPLLSLKQIEDLMDDDSHNPVQGDPMLCSSPSSRICLKSEDMDQQSTISQMLTDDGSAMLGISSSTSDGQLLISNSSNQQLCLSLLSPNDLLNQQNLSSLLGGSGHNNKTHSNDCFPDSYMEIGG